MRRNCHSEFYLGGGHKYELGSHLHPRRQHFWPFTTLEKNIGGPAAGSGCLRRKLDLVVEKEEHSLVLSSKRIVKLFPKIFFFLSLLLASLYSYIYPDNSTATGSQYMESDSDSESDSDLPDWIVNTNVFEAKPKPTRLATDTDTLQDSQLRLNVTGGSSSSYGIPTSIPQSQSQVQEPPPNNNNDNINSYQNSSTAREDDDKNQFVTGAQHTLVLIDCQAPMFDNINMELSNEDSGDDDSDSDSDSASDKDIGPFGQFLNTGSDEENTQHKSFQSQSQHTKKSKSKSKPPPKTIVTKPFDVAIRLATRLMELKVANVSMGDGGLRDGVGILLYGTKRMQTPGGSKNVKLLVPVAPPGVNEITELDKCVPNLEALTQNEIPLQSSTAIAIATATNNSNTGHTPATSQTQTQDYDVGRDLMAEFGDIENSNAEVSEIAKQVSERSERALRKTRNSR